MYCLSLWQFLCYQSWLYMRCLLNLAVSKSVDTQNFLFCLQKRTRYFCYKEQSPRTCHANTSQLSLSLDKFMRYGVGRVYSMLIYIYIQRADIYRVSQEECARLRESVLYVKVYRYNPKHLYPKLNGYGDNGQRSLKL